MNIFKLLAIAVSFFAISCSTSEAGLFSTTSNRSLESNKEFEVAWDLSDIKMIYNNRRPNMAGAPGKIIIVGWTKDAITSGEIIGLDSVNGNIAWTVSYGTNSDSIITQGETLYRGTIGTASVQSYHTQSGELLWDTRLPWAHSVSDIYSANNKIFVHTNDNEFFILNDKGEILDNFSGSFRVFLEIDGILYMEDNFAIKALNTVSKKELWRLEIEDRYTHAPIFDNGTIFLRTRNIPAYIYSIDQYSGKINWEVLRSVLSNLYVSGKKIYYISFDGYLVTIDRYTGSEISKVKFTPPFDLNKQVGDYFVTGDPTNNILAVSFGDNTQIMGLKIIRP